MGGFRSCSTPNTSTETPCALSGRSTLRTDWTATADNLGSVRDVVNASSVVVDHIVYASGGLVTYESNTSIHHWAGYGGFHTDVDTGALYAGQRWYDPAVIRLESEDPLGFRGGDPNLSRFFGNDTVAFADPGGPQPTPKYKPPDPEDQVTELQKAKQQAQANKPSSKGPTEVDPNFEWDGAKVPKQNHVEGMGRTVQDGVYSRNHGGRRRGGRNRGGFITTPRPRPFGGGAPRPRGGGVGKVGGVGTAVGGLGTLYDYFSGAAQFWDAVVDNFDPFAPTTLGNSDIQPPPEPPDDTST